MPRVRRGLCEIDLGIVQGAAQERLTLVPLAIPDRRLLDAGNGEIGRYLDRTRQEDIVNKRRGVLELETLFRVPESFLQVLSERHDVIKVGEPGVALDGFLGEGGRLGEARAHDKEFEVEHVRKVFFLRLAPLANLFGAQGQRVGPHSEREPSAHKFTPAGALIEGLEAALVDGELVARNQFGQRESKFVKITVLDALYHRFLEFCDGAKGDRRFATGSTIVDNEIGKVIR